MSETATKTEIAKAPEAIQPPAAPTGKAPVVAGGKLAALVPQDIESAFRVASALAASGDMVPKHFQGRPNEIMAAIMRGMEVGLAPMQALSHIAVINGRATIWGDAIPALLLRAGHFVDVEVEGEGDSLKATATLTRADGRKVVRTFSMADAKKAGLAGKPGPWQQYPQRMVAMRARAWAARDGAPDALMGIEIAEEVRDSIGPDNARDVTPSRPRRGGVMYDEPGASDPFANLTDPVAEAEIVDDATRIDDLFAAAEAEAKNGGTLAFMDWWRVNGDEQQKLMAAEPQRMSRIRDICAEVDAALAANETEAEVDTPADDGASPTPEEMEAAEREAMKSIAQQSLGFEGEPASGGRRRA